MTAAPASSSSSSSGPTRPRGRARIAAVLIVSLLASAFLQQAAYSFRSEAINRGRPKGAPAASRLANLDSYSLALLLGGLRGPLVMFLWTSSEAQKSDRDLESFGTKVEMIRLLQPEFDSVHLFQIWNLAYNVSVQYATNANKYGAILDAIDYGRRAEQLSPDNINLVSAIGGVYADKLGGSTEKEYYTRRVRTETLPVYRIRVPDADEAAFRKAMETAGLDAQRVRFAHDPAAPGKLTALLDKLVGDRVIEAFGKDKGLTVEAVPRQTLRPANATARRYDMETLLDANGNILPELLTPTRPGVDPATNNDGSELQYLKPFQPFKYGIPPIALGYNYLKRAQVLQVVGHQKHAQSSEYSVHSRPNQTLRAWAEEEWERGRRLEARALGIKVPPAADPAADKSARERATASVAADAKVVDRAAMDETIFSYDRAAQVAEAAAVELDEHVKAYPTSIQTFSSMADQLRAMRFLMRADAAYDRAIAAGDDAAARKAQLAEAAKNYPEAARYFYILALKYYVDEADAGYLKYVRADVPKMTLEQMRDLFKRVRPELAARYKSPDIPHLSDLAEYADNISRIDQRLARAR
jgi:hypothetical protein